MAGTSPEERTELVHRGHAAYERGDIESVLALLDPEIEIYAPPDVGNPGTYHGHDGFLHWIGHWNEAWDEFRQELRGVEPIGERHVVADMLQTARGRASGVELDLAVTYVYEVRDGRLTYLSLYLDGEQARAAARGREARGEHLESRAAMPVKQDAVGKEWPPAEFEVEAERIHRYAEAVGEENPVHHDAEAARQAGFRDLVAPPMFCVVYAGQAMGPALLDPEVGMNFATMVHGGQEFEWDEPVCAGDVIKTTVRCKEISERNGLGFYVFESTSTNQDGRPTARGTWTNIVRGV